MLDSLLSKVQKSQVKIDPFPHLVIKNPVDPEICARLIREFPEIGTVTRNSSPGSNQRYSYSVQHSLIDPAVSSFWKEFVQVHTSQEFLDQVLFLFKDEIRKSYPFLEEQMGDMEHWSAGKRNIDNFENADILLDAQISVNTPVVERSSSVRRGHVDLPDKLFAGLYYLRPTDDTSKGGDLEIYRFKQDKIYGFKGSSNQYVDDENLEIVQVVPYESNVLVLFLNSVQSLHGVTVRSVTDSPRFFFNLLGEVNCPLFSTDPYRKVETWSDRLVSSSQKSFKNIKENLKNAVSLIN